MRKRTRIGSIVCLLLLTVLAGCSSGGPKGVVKAYVDAINKGDCEKAVSLVSPDQLDRGWRPFVEEHCRYREVEITGDILVRDYRAPPGSKEVVVPVETKGGEYARTSLHFVVEQLNGRWSIFKVW